MFATRKIKNGEYICIERPLIVCPSSLSTLGSFSRSLERNITQREYNNIALSETESWLKIAFDRITRERQRQYLSLANR